MKNKQKYLSILCIIFSVLIIVKYQTTNEGENQRAEQLHFSNTALWDKSLLEEMRDYRAYTEQNNVANEFKIKNFPTNSSRETRDEIDYLLSLKEQRTVEKIDEINKERSISGMYFNSIKLTDYFDINKYDFAKEFRKAFSEISSLVLFEKEKFDRVRPHLLEPNLEPIIEVPGHPAYPSGHATQAYFTAYYLSAKYPDNRAIYFEDAARIATNREIAGVHYPSDSIAGKILAEQYFISLPQRDFSNYTMLVY